MKFVHSEEQCWGNSIFLKSLGTKYQYEGEAKVAELFKFIKPKLVPSQAFEMEPKYERAVFDIEQAAIILFGASEEIVNSFGEKMNNNALLITCNQDSEIC